MSKKAVVAEIAAGAVVEIDVVYEANEDWTPGVKLWERSPETPKHPPFAAGKRYLFGLKQADGTVKFEPSGRVQA